MNAVSALGAAVPLAPAAPVAPVAEVASTGFASEISSALQRVDGMQHASDDALKLLASGGDVDLHGSMIALEQAEISLKAMVSVRDKVVSAYETLLNLAI